MRTLLAATCLMITAAAGAAPASQRDDLIGSPSIQVTRAEDTLLDLARNADIGYVAIRAANPAVDPWLPGAGRTIEMPTRHILPEGPRRGIVINLPELRLYYFPPSGPARSFPLGIGGEGRETPVGSTRVESKRRHPVWYPTESERAEDPDLPERVPAGPDNPMGDYALYLGWRGYAIHGTNREFSIGRRDSHGCVRLYPEDIARLYAEVPEGTPVAVIDQRVKLGWSNDELYIEIHPDQAEADLVENGQEIPPETAPDVDDMVIAAAGPAAGRIDWYSLHLAAQRRTGMPVRILR